MPTLPVLDELKATCQTIHFFGLGFIQVKISDKLRYHFYTDKWPKITPKEEVHNHRYDFTSRVLKGSLQHEIFFAGLGKDYEMWYVDCKAGAEEKKSTLTWDAVQLTNMLLKPDSMYQMPYSTFHRVSGYHGTITKLIRSEIKVPQAAVLRPVGTEKVCPFSNVVPEAELWTHIEELLKR